MKHMSQSVQASTTAGNASERTPSSSPVAELSIRSNSRGNDSHKLKQRRQPWQMSKTRRISSSILAESRKSGCCHSIGWRVGASRLPSRIMVRIRVKAGPEPASQHEMRAIRGFKCACRLAERIERFLEAPGVALLGLRQGFEPIGDFVETFVARG